jgi:hypothetical protein
MCCDGRGATNWRWFFQGVIEAVIEIDFVGSCWLLFVLANARPVSPSASYLKRHQVTKCPGSWLGSSFVGIPSLRRRSVGPRRTDIHVPTALSRHPCRSAHSTSPAFSLHPSRDLCRLNFRALRSKIKSEHSSGVSREPCGRRRRSRRQRSGGSGGSSANRSTAIVRIAARTVAQLRRLPQRLVSNFEISALHTSRTATGSCSPLLLLLPLILLLSARFPIRPQSRLGCRLNAGGVEWAERHGCRESRPPPWMADGGVPTERRRSEGIPTKEEPNQEQGLLVTFWLLKK